MYKKHISSKNSQLKNSFHSIETESFRIQNSGVFTEQNMSWVNILVMLIMYTTNSTVNVNVTVSVSNSIIVGTHTNGVHNSNVNVNVTVSEPNFSNTSAATSSNPVEEKEETLESLRALLAQSQQEVTALRHDMEEILTELVKLRRVTSELK
jgi:hypothetical protein